jgi:uncharacterized integral membrane protein (TIGR00698 family)
MKSLIKYIPGLLLMTLLVFLAKGVSAALIIGGKQPLEAILLVIIFGISVRNFGRLPTACLSGIKSFSTLLAAGIVLLGFSLSLGELFNKAKEAVVIVTICVLIAPLLIYYLGKWAGLPRNLALLIGIGTTICGGTAIAMSAPIIEAEDEEVSYAIATIALFGLAAIFIYPLIGYAFSFSDKIFGLWAGTGIHSTPQVLAAGFSYSDGAGQIATIAKLFRNLYIIPAIIFMSVFHQRQKKNQDQANIKISLLKAVPKFVIGFLALVALRTIGDKFSFLPEESYLQLITVSKSSAKFLLLLAMAGIGLRTDLGALKRIGLKPFCVGLAGSLLLGALSIALILLVV